MLTALQLQQQRRRRAVPSLKQQYHEYILQRIESFKESLSRRELLDLGNEAVAEMESAQGGQFFLTEVLVADWVDRLIHRRLGLQPYSRWAKHFRALRAAQREPTHWGIDRRNPVTRLLQRLEPGDLCLVIGPDAAPAAYLLAAHDIEVIYTGADLPQVDQVETRVAEEALGHYCTTYVTPLGQLPPLCPAQLHVVIMDTRTLDRTPASARRELLERLMDRTVPCGVHLLLPSERALSPDAFLSHYGEWIREEVPIDKRKPARGVGIMLSRPPEVAAEPLPSARSRDATA